MAKNEALTVVDKNTALTAPADMAEHAGHGTEGIGSADVRPTRLALAQSGTPQTKRANDKYIDGLAEGDLFNDLTNERYKTPVAFVVIKYLGRRAMEFFSEEERKKSPGSVIKDRNVPLNDPRCLPTTDADGNWVPPAADIFADYLVYLPETSEVVTITFKNKDLSRNGVATTLNSLMRYPLKIDGTVVLQPPAWARTFELGSAGKQDGAYSWSVFTLKLRGISDPDVRQIAGSLYDQFKASNVIIEDAPEGDTEAKDDKVPF
jgi:hypothetical protein